MDTLTPTFLFCSSLSIQASHQHNSTELSLIASAEQLLFTISKFSCLLSNERLASIRQHKLQFLMKRCQGRTGFFRPTHTTVKEKRPKAESDISVAFFQVKAEVKYPLWQCSKGRKTKKKFTSSLTDSSVQLSVLLPFMLYNTSATHKLETRLTLQKNKGSLIKKREKKSQTPTPNKQERTNSLINLEHSHCDYRLDINSFLIFLYEHMMNDNY